MCARFRLAALYMRELIEWDLADIPDVDLDELLKDGSKGLYSFYDCILDRIRNNRHREDMFVILKWLLVSVRPLTVAELVDACATVPEAHPSFDTSRKTRVWSFPDRLVGLVVLNSTAKDTEVPLGASYVDDPQDPIKFRTVSLAHLSVREYLLRMEPRGWSSIEIRLNLELSELYAAQCCLAYLKHCRSKSLGRTRSWPFRAYAWRSWATHIACWHRNDSLQENDFSTLGNVANSSMYNMAMELFNTACFPALEYQKGSTQIDHEADLLAAGRCDSMVEFKHSYNDVLQDPEYEFDFSKDDLHSKLRRPIYQAGGQPDPDFPLGKMPGAPDLVHRFPPVSYYKTLQQDNSEEGTRRSFDFAPLVPFGPAIRLIVLHPAANRENIIMCSQLVESLENEPRYTALSYSWYYGDEPDVIVLVNGCECKIKPNLAKALIELRLEHRPRILWIDALCMSMRDLRERGAHVRIMDQIYHNADRVIIWLGADNSCIEDRIEELKFWGSPSTNKGTDSVHVVRMMPWYCIKVLFKHSVWRKSWILLEVAVASTIVIASGTTRLEWTTLENASRLAKEPPEVEDPCSTLSMFEIYRQLRQSVQSRTYLSLPELLFMTRHFNVSDAKDKILTMIPLLNPTEREVVSPLIDYNLSVLDLSVSIAEYCLQRMQNIDILSMCNPRRGNDHVQDWPSPWYVFRETLYWATELAMLPSWVPAWDCTHYEFPLATGEFSPKEARKFAAELIQSCGQITPSERSAYRIR